MYQIREILIERGPCRPRRRVLVAEKDQSRRRKSGIDPVKGDEEDRFLELVEEGL